jgi:hypothetical protein
MTAGSRWSGKVFILISAMFSFILFSFSYADAAPLSAKEMIKPESNMLQFKAGNHVLGFSPDRAYLASMDHALSVQFVGTKGVMPKADTTAPATGSVNKAAPLSKVVYQDLWEGISLTYIATKAGITESIYHVAPGADVSKIKLKYNVPVEKQKDGSLKFKFSTGNLTESAPIAWQEINGRRQAVKVAFVIKDETIGFAVGKYDRTRQLIIDPTYQWHTFHGLSSSVDSATGITTDSSGNVYVTGNSTSSWDGPSSLGSCSTPGVSPCPLNAFSSSGHGNIFVLKLDSSGNYQWHTFYGSNDTDSIYSGIAADSSGNVYVTGYSVNSWDGPSSLGACSTPGVSPCPLNAYSGSGDIFVLKLNSSGAYQWHTFYGSVSSHDIALGIAVTGGGNVYVTGLSYVSWDGPSSLGSCSTPGVSPCPLNAYSGNRDMVVLKLNSSGAYQWHTFYGSVSGHDYGTAIAADSSGNAYVTGLSFASWDGPSSLGSCSTPGVAPCPLNAFGGSANFFILKLAGSGAYQWHTFYGSSSDDAAKGIAIDGSGNVYATGYSSDNWKGPAPESSAPLHDYSGGGYDIFVLKLNSSGTYQWHTFHGSSDEDSGYSIASDSSGNVYVTGKSDNPWNGPGGESPVNAYVGDSDIVVLRLDSSGTYQWHAFYGSGNTEEGGGIAVDSNNNVFIAGYGAATWAGPGSEAPRNAYTGSREVIVLKLSDPDRKVRLLVKDIPAGLFPGLTVAFNEVHEADDVIQAQATTFTETLVLENPESLMLKGGYNSDFVLNPGKTTLSGSLTMRGVGGVTVENLTIK